MTGGSRSTLLRCNLAHTRSPPSASSPHRRGGAPIPQRRERETALRDLSMAMDGRARKPRDILKDLLDIGQELLINQVRLKDSRGELKAKLHQEADTLHRRLDICLREIGVSLEASGAWQHQLKQARDDAHTRGLMLGLVLGAATGAGLGVAGYLLFVSLQVGSAGP